MIENLKEIKDLVQDLKAKKILPSTIGHILRDQYNIRIKKLCKYYIIDLKSLLVEKTQSRLSTLKEHLKKNKQDFVSKRALKRGQSKLYNLKNDRY